MAQEVNLGSMNVECLTPDVALLLSRTFERGVELTSFGINLLDIPLLESRFDVVFNRSLE